MVFEKGNNLGGKPKPSDRIIKHVIIGLLAEFLGVTRKTTTQYLSNKKIQANDIKEVCKFIRESVE